MKILGIGSALVDVLVQIDNDNIINELNLFKGGMQLINFETREEIKKMLEPFSPAYVDGGSGANTINGIAKLGMSCGFIGKVGQDEFGKLYRASMLKNGVKPFLFVDDNLQSGTAMAMISPDGERTFGTYLGAASNLKASEIDECMFDGYDLFFVEGYLIVDPELIIRAMTVAKQKGLVVAMDMASYNLVNSFLELQEKLVREYVDILFVNEDEAHAYTGCDPREAVAVIARQCDIAVVKCGKEGSYVQRGDVCVCVPATDEKCIDSTGAGDLYAAGFLYALSQGASLGICAQAGSIVAGKVIEVIGTKLEDHKWDEIKLKLEALCPNSSSKH